jgi:hypothetical protein
MDSWCTVLTEFGTEKEESVLSSFKGTVSRDFLLQVFFFLYHYPQLGPQAQAPEITLGSSQIFSKFAEIFECQGAPLETTTLAPVNFPTGTTGVINTGGDRQQIATVINDTSGKSNNIIKTFLTEVWKKFQSICHRCQQHRWCTLSREYLRKFSKISWHGPFKELNCYGLAHEADEKSIPAFKIEDSWAMSDSFPHLVLSRFQTRFQLGS